MTIATRREGAMAVVEVRDEGIGIASDHIHSVFDLFAQAGQAGTKRSHGGREHPGSQRGLGRGSTFTVRLPSS